MVGASGGLPGAAVPKAVGTPAGETGSPALVVVGAQGGLAGCSNPQGPGIAASRDGESCQGGGRCSRRACGGQQSPRPGHTSLGGRGVLPRRWSVLKEDFRGQQSPRPWAHQPGGTGSPALVVVGAQGGPAGGSSPQGRSTPAWGEVESCLGGGRCLRRASGGSSPQGRGHTSPGGRGVLPLWWSVLKEGPRGVAVPKAGAQRPWGRWSPA